MSDFNSLVQYTVENISRPVKYIIYKLTEFIRVVDKFVFRPVPAGAASGYATIEKIEGNTVAWNQLVNGAFDNLDHWTKYTITASVNDNVLSFVKSTSGAGYLVADIAIITGHKYYYSALINQPDGFTLGIGFVGSANTNYGRVTPTVYGSFERISNVFIGDSSYEFVIRANNASIGTALCRDVVLIDLTLLGIGILTTIAQVEAWLAQNIGTLPYYDYNAGELLSVKMSGMQTEDSSQQTLDTIALDVTTITGINSITNVREVIFPNGMRSAGSVHDTLTASEAVVRIGSRTYQSGDESDSAVITDGTNTLYALSTPITYTDLQDANGNPLNPRYKVEQGGTEQVLPVNTSTPTTVAPTLTTTYTKDVH